MPSNLSRLRPLAEADAGAGDEVLRAMVGRNGYVLVRGALDREEVRACRALVCRALDKEWGAVDRSGGAAVEDARIKAGAEGVLLTGYRAVTHSADFRRLLEGRRLARLVGGVLGRARVATFDQKWVRVHGRGGWTDEHTDYFRFRTCADEGMVTAWVPLGDYRPEDGVLAVCAGSHLADGMGGSGGNGGDDDDDEPEAKSELPRGFQGGEWRASEVRMGDVVVFDIRLVHASTRNGSDAFRISADTRWRPAFDQPDDGALASSFREVPT